MFAYQGLTTPEAEEWAFTVSLDGQVSHHSGNRALVVISVAIYKFTPFLKGSVLDALIQTSITVGLVAGVSTVISLNDRWAVGASCDGTVISPALMNPKKHDVEAAHSIMRS